MGTCVICCFIIQKANRKYFWTFLFPNFPFIWASNQSGYNFKMSYLWPFSQRKVRYEIRSLVLYIPAEKCSLLNIYEKKTHIGVSCTDTQGKNIFLSPPLCNSITFSHSIKKMNSCIIYPKAHILKKINNYENQVYIIIDGKLQHN